MNLIIPMGGQGKRLRPHTLTVPKPLLPIAGKPIVERIVEEIADSIDTHIDKLGFIVTDVSKETKIQLSKVAEKVGATPMFYQQDHPLGTAHAIFCAEELLEGKVMITFSDTLFKSKFDLDLSKDGIIWTKKVEDPAAFGVVVLNENGTIKTFVEKPSQFVSDEAIVGIYYFNKGEKLKREIKYLLDNDIKTQGEYQLTHALKNMIDDNSQLITQNVDEWLDCGNKEAIIHTHKRLLTSLLNSEKLVDETATIHNSILIPPVYIGTNAIIHNSVVGPHVSIGNNTNIYDTRIQNSIIQSNSNIKNTNLKDAMMGSHVNFIGKPTDASIGDYSSTVIS